MDSLSAAMPSLRQSQISQLGEPDAFFWAAGIEDSFITAPSPTTGRTLDEYELTGHYERWREDIDLIHELGVRVARYGIPWHRINPAPDRWNWEWTDQAINRLLELGIEPIIDLVHYGLPPWIERAYLHADFPRFMAEYATRVAERYRGRVFAYTPLNEPRTTAWYCGRLGWWPPFQRSWHGFVAVTLAVCRGIVETTHALRAVDPEILPLPVDATDLYESRDPALAEETAHRQAMVFLALDLVSGRVTPEHELWRWLLSHGATEAQLSWFQARPVELHAVGLNLYPMFTLKRAQRSARGTIRWRMPYAGSELIDRVTKMYWERYRVPLWISETSSTGSVRRRRAWLNQSVAAVHRVRAAGIPLAGYTWWPIFALVTWAYRQGRHPPPYYLKQMGLWNVNTELHRLRTPLVDAYHELVGRGAADAGQLGAPDSVAVHD